MLNNIVHSTLPMENAEYTLSCLQHYGRQSGRTELLLEQVKGYVKRGWDVILLCADYQQALYFDSILKDSASPLFLEECTEKVKLYPIAIFYMRGKSREVLACADPSKTIILTDHYAQDKLIQLLINEGRSAQQEIKKLQTKQEGTQQLIGDLVRIWGL